ncbi:MAG: methyltransferase domain-containing protein [Chloroflexota bacterium]
MNPDTAQRLEQMGKELYQEEYTEAFVDRWDELIDWQGRLKAEGTFFPDRLNEHNVKTVLDAACGTGFHTVTLAKAGFDVTGADGAQTMVDKAEENCKRFGVGDVPVVLGEWTTLSDAFPGQTFDAIVVLGNAFTHLFDEGDRKKALAEFYKLLNPGGVVVIDHRNYDSILDEGYSTKHRYYYTGSNVEVFPEEASEEVVKMKYHYEDGSDYYLTMCPIRQEYISGLLREAGFKNVERYGDFKKNYEFYDPDFIVQIAEK